MRQETRVVIAHAIPFADLAEEYQSIDDLLNSKFGAFSEITIYFIDENEKIEDCYIGLTVAEVEDSEAIIIADIEATFKEKIEEVKRKFWTMFKKESQLIIVKDMHVRYNIKGII